MSFLLGILFALNANAQTEITNLNFESWNGTEPSNWTTSNELSTDGGGVQTAFKETTNPGEGSASLKLVTGSCPECPNFQIGGFMGFGGISLPFPNPVGGFIQLGEYGEGVPYNKRPVSVDFIYKAKPMGNDAACFHIQLTRYNNSTNQTDTIGECYFEVSNTVDEWTQMNIPFAYSSPFAPDTINILITSSVGSVPDYSAMFPGFPSPSQLGIPSPVAGSEFYIDGIVFNMPSCDGFSVNVTGTNETSIGAMDGTATATPNGGTSPYTYIWNNLATTQTINNLPPATYFVTVTDGNACQKVGKYTVNPAGCNISVNVTGTNSNSNSIFSGTGSATANVTGGNPPYSYTWNNGEETQTITNLAVGAYSVLVEEINNSGCVAWGFYTVYGPNGAAVENEFIGSIKMYPNPIDDFINVNGDVEITEVSIYDGLGRLVTHSNIYDTSASINVSSFEAGIYIVLINTEKGILESKFIKE